MNYRSGGVSHNVAPVMDYLKQIKIFTTFSQYLKPSQNDPVKIENFIFTLHSKVTVTILMVGTMFLSMRQYFGEPIECLARGSDISPALLQNYCWLEGSFSVQDSSGKAAVDNVAYPGVKTLNEAAGERKQSHKYYQWVYFVLIIQAIMFYIPKYLWKQKEARRLKTLIHLLTQRHIMEWSEQDRRKLTQDVFDSILISNDYFFFFFFCEFLYFIHLILQMWFCNVFLSGQFLKLGWDWLFYSHNENQQDPLIRVFPRLTKCSFHKYGFSGSIESHDALCFLTLNIVNEKIYTLLWFWFAFLFIMTSLALINRIVLILFPAYRYWKIVKLAPSTDKKVLKRLCSRVGNFFVLFHLSNNLKPSHFRDLIDFLVKEHFDKNCNLIIGNNKVDQRSLNNIAKNNLSLMAGMQMNNNKMMMAPTGPMIGMPSAPGMQTMGMNMNTNTGGKKKTNKPNYGRNVGSNVKAANFVSVNRDPPSGHSGDSDECSAMNLGHY